MSEEQSQRSVASSTQHWQEAEVAAPEERERAAVEIAATTARAARLAMAKLAATRAEVEATAAVDAARAAAVELDALCGSRISSSVSADGGTNDELKLAREAAREQESCTPRGAVAAAQTGADAPAALRTGARVAAVPPTVAAAQTGADAPAAGSDGDRSLYRRCGSPSPDRYDGHRGIQAIVRDIGPGVGWHTLTKTNYIEWAAVMWIRLQVLHMWEAVRYNDVDYYEDRRALDALIAVVPTEMQFSLSKKRAAKEA
jgi:hypothetical protein